MYNPVSNSNTLDKDKVDLLNQILKETGAYIVLSSAWRYLCHRNEMNLVGLSWLLRSHGIMDGRLLDVIGPDEMVPCDTNFNGVPGTWPKENGRGKKIREWLNSYEKKIDKYVVIDDLDLGISEAGLTLIHVDGTKGLQPYHVALAIDLLSDRKDKECIQ